MSPWPVQGHCLSIQKWESSIGITHIDFKRVQFWVQVHDLGLEKFSSESARTIGDTIETFVETEEGIEKGNKTYIRMKVEVNIDNPLVSGFWWTNSKGSEQWANMKYERLSDYCYGCGKLANTTQVYRAVVVRSEERPGFPMYGPWMSVTRQKPTRASIIGGGQTGNEQTGQSEPWKS